MALRTPRPATGVSQALRVPGVSRRCPGHTGHFLDTPEPGARSAPETPPLDTPSSTPCFRGHPRGHAAGTSGPKGPRDSCSRPGGSQRWPRHFGPFAPGFVVISPPKWRPIPVERPIVVLLRCPLFCRYFGYFGGSWNPNSPFVLFDPRNGPFHAPQHYVLKGNCPFLTRNSIKLGKNRRNDKWFSRMYSPTTLLPLPFGISFAQRRHKSSQL